MTAAEDMPADLVVLVDQARAARERAYAPYSQYRVGAAVRATDGTVFTGCNVENASYGVTLCAERVAIATMVSQGRRELDAIAVFTDGEPLGMPCGVCRQTLNEFAGAEATVVAASPTRAQTTTVGALLPEPFVLRR